MKIFIKFSNSHQHNYLKNKIFKNESLRLVVSRSKMLEKYQIRSFIKRALSAPGVGVSAKEMKKFDSLASYWWDESGFFKALHSFNRVRVPWIVDSLSQRASYSDPLKGRCNITFSITMVCINYFPHTLNMEGKSFTLRERFLGERSEAYSHGDTSKSFFFRP